MVQGNQNVTAGRAKAPIPSRDVNPHATQNLQQERAPIASAQSADVAPHPRISPDSSALEMVMPSQFNTSALQGATHSDAVALKTEIAQMLAAAYKNKNLQSAVFAVDIGGTKISYGLFPVSGDGQIQPEPFYRHKVDTIRGRVQIAQALQACFKDAIAQATAQGYHVLPAISAGSPGRFVGAQQNVIAPKSAANLEVEAGEFDNLALNEFLSEFFPDYINIKVKNDALSQMSAGLSQLMACETSRASLLGQKVAYIGPGTGLGGGFCTVDDAGRVEFFSDGHIIDNPIEDKNGDIRGAEDVFSGRAFEALTGMTAKAVNSDQETFERHRDDVKLMGCYLAKIIQGIHQGRLEKVDPDARWPQADIEKATGTKVFLVGGSMGTQGQMGALIQATAREQLQDEGLGDIRVIPITDAQDAALLGTAEFMSQAELLHAQEYIAVQ